MMRSLALTILTPEGVVFSGETESLVAPGIRGKIGVMAGHEPMIAALELGLLKVRRGNEWDLYVVGDGLLEVGGEGAYVLTGLAFGVRDADEGEHYLLSLSR